MKAPIPLPNKSTSYQSHRQQFIWHILLPVLFAVALIVVAGVLTVTQNTDQTHLWSDISIIWLLIPLLIFSLVFLVVLATLIYAIDRVLKVFPIYTYRAQKLAKRVKQGTRRAADAAVKPVLFIEGINASLRVITRCK